MVLCATKTKAIPKVSGGTTNLADKFVNTIKGLYPFGIHGLLIRRAAVWLIVFIDGLPSDPEKWQGRCNDKDRRAMGLPTEAAHENAW